LFLIINYSIKNSLNNKNILDNNIERRKILDIYNIIYNETTIEDILNTKYIIKYIN